MARIHKQGLTELVNGFSAEELREIYSSTGCSAPGVLRLDAALLCRFHPEWFPKGWKKYLVDLAKFFGRKDPIECVRVQLLLGDRSPAIVVAESPFLVAAYSEEQDCIVMLEFDPRAIDPNYRSIGTRLTTLNLDYSAQHGPTAADLRPGPNSSGRWTNFLPIIGEFLSRDYERLAQLKNSIPGSWWSRLSSMIQNYSFDYGVRDGRPGYAAQPAVGTHTWRMFDRGS